MVSRLITNESKSIEQCTLKNVNNYLNTNIYPYLETSGGEISNLHLNSVDWTSVAA